ncbi:MAG: hypothetical protein MUE49_04360 [Rhodospirillales bacterium]|jgi:hypothetical protein|nr:hypothetical protein [Rhodospirillales bacterium]
MAFNEQDYLEDLAYESEGASDLFEDEQEFDSLEDSYEEDAFEDEFEADFEDEFEDESDAIFADEMEAGVIPMLGAALGAEDEDEFFGKIFSAAKKLAPKILSGVGKVARFAAPALKAIPHPYAQLGSKVAGLLGNLRAEGASTEDALEAVAEVAVRDRRALPVVAGLAARTLIKNKGATMSPQQRRQAVRSATKAANTLVAAGGPRAVRALPKVAKSVRRTAIAKGTPAAVRPQVLQRTAAKVAQNPMLLKKLSRPSPKGQALAQRNGGTGRSQSFTVAGPARIQISVT